MRIASTWSFGQRANEAAWSHLVNGSALDAVEAACCYAESDASIDSVGYGGLPDASGRVSLDGCVMLSPSRCGSVAGLRTHLHPVSIARAVMEHTQHVMLVGCDADEFADNAFGDRQANARAELLAPSARAAFEKWQRDGGVIDQSRDAAILETTMPADEARWRHHDTIGCLAIDARGMLAGGCSTSGIPFKLPGRVGDSPIIGHGLYVDPDIGAATATGAGELIMGICGAFLVIESMRRGASASDAVREAVKRIARTYTLAPHHQAAFVVMTKDGAVASASLRPGYRTSVRDGNGSRVVEPEFVALPDSSVTEPTA